MNCGECTVCCTLSVVPELEKGVGEECVFCKNSKCSIYGKHPQVCKDFKCAYLEAGIDNALRPDKCGIMFVKKNDRIFTGMKVPDVPLTAAAKGQILAFTGQGFSVVLLALGEKANIVLAPGHDMISIKEEYKNLLKNGNL